MTQAKRDNQVTDKITTFVLQVIQDPGSVFCSCSKLEKPLLHGHKAAIKSFVLQKKNSDVKFKLARSDLLADLRRFSDQFLFS